ncbi:WD40 repeat domain-containing protein [Streptomyces sp. NPDC093149]|uniref:WD40 repeat domain-containing protein n=1 Tax=Streptomyces sp. NPDC093149 TaxID=3366031 RepID=UPI0037F85CA8
MSSNVLSPDVRSQVYRLKGRIPEGFRPREWVVRTPVGMYPVPPAVQALLAMEWPSRQRQRLIFDDESGREVHLGAYCEVENGLVEEETPRAWYAIGYDQGQCYLVVDLADMDGDFRVYQVDHEGGEEAGEGLHLSTLLSELRSASDHFDFPAGTDRRPGAARSAIDAHTFVHARPDELLPLLDHVTSVEDRLASHVYRTSVDRHRDSDPVTRRQVLAMDAVRWRADELACAITAVPVDGAPAEAWAVEWATGSQLDPRVRGRYRVGSIQVTAVAQGRPVLVAVGTSALHVIDLATGATVVEARLESPQKFRALAVTEAGGRWIAVTGAACVGRCDDGGCGGGCGGRIERWSLTDGTPAGAPITGHLGSVRAVAVASVAGKQVIISGGGDRVLRMWDLETGAPLNAPSAEVPDLDETGAIAAIAVGEEGGRTIAVTGAEDGTGLVWDLESGGTLGRSLTSDDPDRVDAWISHASIARFDGRPTVVTSGDDKLRLWDPQTGKQLGDALGEGCVRSAVAEIDGQSVVVTASYRGVVKVWDLRDRRVVRGPVSVLSSSGGYVDALSTAFVNGRLVVLVSKHGHTVVVDLEAAPVPGEGPRRGHADEIIAVAVGGSDSGAHLVTGSRADAARVWNVGDGTELHELCTVRSAGIKAVAATRLGDRPAVVTAESGKLRVWDPSTGELTRTIGVGGRDGHQVLGMSVLDHSHRTVAFTAGYDGRVLGWDLAEGGPAGLPSLTGHAQYIKAALPMTVGDQPVVAVTDLDTVRIWDPASGETTRTLRHERNVECMTVLDSAARQLLITACHDTLHIWDPATAERLGSIHTGDTVRALSAAEIDGQSLVAVGGYRRTVRLWDAATCQQVGSTLTLPDDVGALALAPGGRLAVAFGPDIALLSWRDCPRRGLTESA